MRGRPYIQWAAFALFWLALAYPLFNVTRGSSVSVSGDIVAREEAETWVHVRFSSMPRSFEVAQGTNVLWAMRAAGDLDYEEAVPLVFDAYGVSLRLVATFSDVERTAVEITLAPDAHPERSATIWSDGDIDELIEFNWESGHE